MSPPVKPSAPSDPHAGHEHGHEHGESSHASHDHVDRLPGRHGHGARGHGDRLPGGHDHGDGLPGGHGHGGHNHARGADEKRLLATLFLGLSYMGVEAVGGWWVGSLALVADAGHMLADAGALALAVLALRVARRPPDALRTYGFHRAEVLAALLNGAALMAVGGGVLVEAVDRWFAPSAMDALPMMAIAAGGLLVNLLGVLILSGADRTGLNVRGAWLHLLSDSLGSAAAIVGGALVYLKGWAWADPLAGVVIAVLIARSAWALVRDCVAVLMETTPAHLSVADIRARLLKVPGVLAVHDLHVWTITSVMVSGSVHVVVADAARSAEILRAASAVLRDDFGIGHCTVQVEPEGFDEAGVHP